MKLHRKSGILLHPTSLPCSKGIGTLGKTAFDFVDWLSESKIKLWQVLPLGPTGYGDSPYQSFSSFALNPLLIDFDKLVEYGIVENSEIIPPDYIRDDGNVDFGSVVYWKNSALKEISLNFINKKDEKLKKEFKSFCSKNSFWLNDYASFMSIKTFYENKGMWNSAWPKKLASHDEIAVEEWNKSHKNEILSYKIIQFFAYKQWLELKDYAVSKNVEIIGDIPIFVSPDSADVWANQKFFQLDKKGVPKAVAGVPPDYFSPTGQLWGNPLYDWKKLKKDGYKWWILRIKQMLTLVDYIRIDHFRGFESYWAVPYGSENAVNGEWLKGPGKDFFDSIRLELGDLPLIAEDLGVITEEVKVLRDECDLPGMKIIQFGFDTGEAWKGCLVNSFLPHNYSNSNCVTYTGTHDNDTTQGMLFSLNEECLCLVASYILGRKVGFEEASNLRHCGELCRQLVKICFSSVANFAIVPLQDIYCVDSSGRMNMPSTSGANWSWRMSKEMLYGQWAEETKEELKELNMLYAR